MSSASVHCLALSVLLATPSCWRAATPPPPPAGTQNEARTTQAEQLQKQLEQIAAAAQGHVGILAVVLETGETVAFNSKDHFPMQSVYKLPICMAVLRQVERGKLTLDQKVTVKPNDLVGPNMHSPLRDRHPKGAEITIRELISFAIVESDGTASDVLVRVVGGPAVIQEYLTEVNVSEMVILNTEKEMGEDWQLQYRNWASSNGAVSLLRALYERRGVSEASRSLLLKFMIDSKPGAKRLKGLLPAGTTVAHKTGTSGSRNGVTAATNDIGIITLPNGRSVAIAVFVSDSPADEATREGVIAKTARAVWDAWAK